MNTDVMFSSKDMTWETPQEFFNEVNKEFNFNLDVCATDSTAKCDKYFTPEIDGLTKSWRGVCWMNPPYGREIRDWVRKAHAEALSGNTIVALLPARTDTRWFHNYIYGFFEIRFIKGRLKFGNAKNSAPFPSMLVIFKDGYNEEFRGAKKYK